VNAVKVSGTNRANPDRLTDYTAHNIVSCREDPLSFPSGNNRPTPKKNLWAYVLWSCLGLLGGHRFYLWRFRTGAAFPCLMILVLLLPEPWGAIPVLCLVGWVVIDLFLIPRMVRSCNDINEYYTSFLREEKQPAKPSVAPQAKSAPAAADRVIEPARDHLLTELRPQPQSNKNLANLVAEKTEILSKDFLGSNQYDIEYADADGVITKRTIDVRDVAAKPWAMYITAWCHTKRSERTFRADRILAARQSGRTSPIHDIEQHFYAYVPEEDLPDPDHDAVMSRVQSGLDVLVWIAMADREITVDEEAILMEFIEERNVLAGAKFADAPWSKNKASILISTLRPTFNTAMGALGKISKTGRQYTLLKRYAHQIADTGGQLAQNRMRKLFRD